MDSNAKQQELLSKLAVDRRDTARAIAVRYVREWLRKSAAREIEASVGDRIKSEHWLIEPTQRGIDDALLQVQKAIELLA